ncbi:cell division protein FtsL [Marinobacter maritimus]|uniref:cell division protein FtsL n=1 Tax=Marinobacter maritimus TaxID=277961 RepID=UPI0011A4F938|nr:cell division protein FtsL [Marinobacter maritimus]|tara:strand:+ start:89 stop:493 length:405 start_codon:yes stop_codon:yes gene_type:complete
MGAVTIEPTVKPAKLNKEKVREGVVAAVRISRSVFKATRQKRVLVSLVLAALLVGSSIGVVIGAHENRTLFNTLSQLQAERDSFQAEWSQLLLEQSSIGSHGRVEKLAAERFNMVAPGRQDIVLVPLMSPLASR